MLEAVEVERPTGFEPGCGALNTRHFPPTSCEPHGISVETPDDLLCDVAEARPHLVLAVLTAQAARKARPPMSLPEMLNRLELHVPRFIGVVRDLAPEKPRG